jgi:hypothetical protein
MQGFELFASRLLLKYGIRSRNRTFKGFFSKYFRCLPENLFTLDYTCIGSFPRNIHLIQFTSVEFFISCALSIGCTCIKFKSVTGITAIPSVFCEKDRVTYVISHTEEEKRQTFSFIFTFSFYTLCLACMYILCLGYANAMINLLVYNIVFTFI